MLRQILLCGFYFINMSSEAGAQTITQVTIQGHRGCRGLFPENTLPAFEHALNLGVTTLELDVFLTSDDIPLVSHDPFMHHELCRTPGKLPISKREEEAYNIYKMTADSCQQYICGMDGHSRFPEQEQVAAKKPTLGQVVELIKAHKSGTKLNIEIKSRADWDNKYHPEPAIYVARFLAYFEALRIAEISTLQSFDERILEELHRQSPELRLIYLSEDMMVSPENKLRELSFKPYGYSPNYKMATRKLVDFCKLEGIHLSVWTINEPKTFKRMLKLGVLDIITDYPNRAMEILKELGIEVNH